MWDIRGGSWALQAAAWVSNPDLLLGPQPSWFAFQGMRKAPSLITRRLASLSSPVPTPSHPSQSLCHQLWKTGHEGNMQKPRNDKFVLNYIYLVVPPELGKSVWVNDTEDLGFLVFPLDVRLVAAVREELVHIIPQQPAV